MLINDMILDGLYCPSFDDITNYINESARCLWNELNTFIKERYKGSCRIMYSKCSAKPGWNVKYQKSGKSLCTIYPERERFIVLVVVTLDLIPAIEAMPEIIDGTVMDIIKSAKPFNGTLWLMIPVENSAVLESVKQLLLLKYGA